MMIFAGDPGTLGGSALASWTPVTSLLVAYVVAVAGLWAYGSPGTGDKLPVGALVRIGRGLTRLTGIPGWAAIAIGQSLFALLVAGVGFYSDVAWHIALGRDDELFTAPHTAILLGLIGILSAAVYGVIVATVDRWDGGWRIAGLTVPYSMLPLGALGVGAVSGFPVDEVWHGAYGVDVTMWSPTHMLMILGASFVGLGGWLVLADARVRPGDGGWARFLHGFAAWLTLQGLVASQGEFSFGVPQFPLIFGPMLISMAAGLGLVAIRLILGPGRALLMAVIFLATQSASVGGDSGPVATRHGAVFLVSALAVEGAAALFGTERRARFAGLSGVGIGTLGLAGEFAWNADWITSGAHQPWNGSLLPTAAVVAVLGATGCAVLATVFARAFAGTAPGREIGAAGVVVALALIAVPIYAMLQRDVGVVTATIELTPATAADVDGAFDEPGVFVTARLESPAAADDAHWFQATSWQGGGLILADMVEVAPGNWRSARPVPVAGLWKTMLRLHRNTTEMMTIPIWFPDDPTIGEPEIPAVDKVAAFEAETDYLLRETNSGNGWLSPLVHGYLVAVVAGWCAAFGIASRRISLDGSPAQSPIPVGTEPAR